MKYLEDIDGIGEKTLMLLNRLDIYDVYDLITYYPKRYDILKRSDMRNISDGDKVIIDGVVEGQPTILNLSPRLKKVIFRISNGRNIYNISVYNKIYLQKELRFGMNVIIIGKYDKLKNTIVSSEVRFGSLSEGAKIEPFYHTTEGLSRKMIGKFISRVLYSDFVLCDYIPDYLCERYNFMNKIDALRVIHSPSSIISLKKARQRVKYEELFLYLFKISYFKYINDNDSNAIAKVFDDGDVQKFIDGLDFELTSDQITSVNNIKCDMRSKKRMNRLVQGDVGCGKTIVAFCAVYMNFLSGFQSALMVPTEVLANQHYEDAKRLFSNYGVKICLLTGSISKKVRNALYDDIRNGNVDLIIGTQSLIQDDLEYYNLGLIITDEQHRFGVNQRERLLNKGVVPDVISMSATPIPRTYALSIYGDMDVSSIKTKPSGRKEVITYFKRSKEIVDVLNLMKSEILAHHQIYVIAPSIEGDDDINNVCSLKEKMELAFGKIAKIGMLHGKMSNDEKKIIMREFEAGKIDILISTTVIEVGVNVINASMVVIFNANMFGLSTLHQLRGRVGRGLEQGYCILIADDSSERLKMLEKCNDGFEISEYDFVNRGEGDLFGIRQSGDAEFKMVNIRRDYKLLVKVRDDVIKFMDDGLFKNDKYNYIVEYIKRDIMVS